MWARGKDSAWIKTGRSSYRHYCGAHVSKNGSQWAATTVAGDSVSHHKTVVGAVARLANKDPLFWTFGQFGPPFGMIEVGGINHMFRPIFGDEDQLILFCKLKETEYPDILKSVLLKYLFGIAKCIACSKLMDEIRTRKHAQFDGRSDERNFYLSCACGCPVWQMGWKLHNTALFAIRNAVRVPRFRRLRAAGGKHNKDEIRAILALQSNRCIYCNVSFTNNRPPSKDHLLPVSCGGSDWAINIVMACKRCNASRGNIPFRTFCKLLTPKQNERILMQLRKRLLALDFDLVTEKAFDCFVEGLALHDPTDMRYLDIQSLRLEARRNAKTNRVLPRTVASLLKRASALEEIC